jgi:hypothetical protein
MKPNRNLTAAASMILVAGTLAPGDSPTKTERQPKYARRRDAQADEPHTHVDKADHGPAAQQTIGAIGPQGEGVPFIDTSARDAANAVAIQAQHDRNMAIRRVAMMSTSPFFLHDGSRPVLMN